MLDLDRFSQAVARVCETSMEVERWADVLSLLAGIETGGCREIHDCHMASGPGRCCGLANVPTAVPRGLEWQVIGQGFDVADLPVLAEGEAVGHIMFARIDPARFRSHVRTESAGDKDLDRWMAQLGAALVVNGSYFSRCGWPDTASP